jgi:nicotinamidase-related amidase
MVTSFVRDERSAVDESILHRHGQPGFTEWQTLCIKGSLGTSVHKGHRSESSFNALTVPVLFTVIVTSA